MWSTTQNTDHRLVLCNGQRSAVIKRSTIRGNAMVNGHWLLCSGQQSLFPQCYYAMVDGRWLCNVHERRWLLVIMVEQCSTDDGYATVKLFSVTQQFHKQSFCNGQRLVCYTIAKLVGDHAMVIGQRLKIMQRSERGRGGGDGRGGGRLGIYILVLTP